jgi:hypothetical protein
VAAETGFLIDGKVYEVPSLDSLTMGERRVMYELCAITQEDFVRGEDETDEEHEERVAKLMRHPGFMESLMHVAYQRANPGVKRAKVQMVVDGTNYLDAVAAMVAAEDEPEDEPVPLESTSLLDGSSPSDSNSLSSSPRPTPASGGTDSGDDLGLPDGSPPNTGTTRSGISSPESRVIGSAA